MNSDIKICSENTQITIVKGEDGLAWSLQENTSSVDTLFCIKFHD